MFPILVDDCEKRKSDELGEECDGIVPEKRQCIETVSSDIFSPMEALVTIAGDRQVSEFTPSPVSCIYSNHDGQPVTEV